MIESFIEAPAREMASFEEIFGLTRTWFETSDGNGLIQVQRDRFLHNWKKERDIDVYPHYDYVIGNFRRCLEKFEAFLQENKLGSIDPVQYELTYINHVPQGEGWSTFGDLGNVFPDFSWRSAKRFLPQPEALIGTPVLLCLKNQVGCTNPFVQQSDARTDSQSCSLN